MAMDFLYPDYEVHAKLYKMHRLPYLRKAVRQPSALAVMKRTA